MPLLRLKINGRSVFSATNDENNDDDENQLGRNHFFYVFTFFLKKRN
jgi:hypothetical protein